MGFNCLLWHWIRACMYGQGWEEWWYICYHGNQHVAIATKMCSRWPAEDLTQMVHWCFISLTTATVAPPHWLEPLERGRTLVIWCQALWLTEHGQVLQSNFPFRGKVIHLILWIVKVLQYKIFKMVFIWKANVASTFFSSAILFCWELSHLKIVPRAAQKVITQRNEPPVFAYRKTHLYLSTKLAFWIR